jgi:hypothetical protein
MRGGGGGRGGTQRQEASTGVTEAAAEGMAVVHGDGQVAATAGGWGG